jgi:hypothetical protein
MGIYRYTRHSMNPGYEVFFKNANEEIYQEGNGFVSLPKFVPFFPEVVNEYELSVLAGLLFGFIVYHQTYKIRTFHFTDNQLAFMFAKKQTQIKAALRELRVAGLIRSDVEREMYFVEECEQIDEIDHSCTPICTSRTKTPRTITLRRTPKHLVINKFIKFYAHLLCYYSTKEILLFGLMEYKSKYLQHTKQEYMSLLGYKTERSLRRAYANINKMHYNNSLPSLYHFFKQKNGQKPTANNKNNKSISNIYTYNQLYTGTSTSFPVYDYLQSGAFRLNQIYGEFENAKPGNRNNALFMASLRGFSAHKEVFGVYKTLQYLNEHLSEPLPRNEVDATTHSALKYVFENKKRRECR